MRSDYVLSTTTVKLDCNGCNEIMAVANKFFKNDNLTTPTFTFRTTNKH